MSKHKNYCPGYSGTLQELAKEINAMTHESRAELFQYLHQLAEKQTKDEETLGRDFYITGLKGVESGLQRVVIGELECWEVCQPYTEIEKRDTK